MREAAAEIFGEAPVSPNRGHQELKLAHPSVTGPPRARKKRESVASSGSCKVWRKWNARQPAHQQRLRDPPRGVGRARPQVMVSTLDVAQSQSY